jgi:hypothetical protein
VFGQTDAAVVTACSWSAPENVSDSSLSSFLGDIGFDSSNHPHVVWAEDASGYSTVNYSKLVGGSWSAPSNISPDLPPGSRAVRPQMAIDEDDRVHVIYSTYGDADVYYTVWDGDSWTAPTTLTDDVELHMQYYPGYPDIAVDRDNNPHVVFCSWVRTSGTTITPCVFYTRWDGNLWTDPICLFFDSGESSLAIDTDGDIHVVGSGGSYINDRIPYCKWDGVSWSTPVEISGIGIHSYWPDVSADQTGNPYVVWTVGANDREHQEVYYNTSGDGGISWQIAAQISGTPGIGSFDPSVDIDATGRVHVVWVEQSGWTGQAALYYTNRTGHLWQPTERISEGIVGRIAASDDGSLHTAWSTATLDECSDVFYATSQANSPPSADAGADQAVIDIDESGQQQVHLDGSGSDDPDGDIVSWTWTEGGTQIAAGETPIVSLSVGEHTITLTVTDNEGAADTDTVLIEVRSQGTAPMLSATKTAEDLNGGTLQLEDDIEFTITITNSGSASQGDNGGNEFEDVLSTGLENLGYVMGTAFASSGTVEYKSSSDPWYRKIVWNGSIPAGGSITIRFTSPVNWGTEASNQGTVYYDSDGDGVNDASVVTDDPNLPGDHDSTVLAVSPNLSLTVVDPIPELVDPNNPPAYIADDIRSVSFSGRRVSGVAADGVAKLVLQLEIDPPTTGTVTLSIEDPDLETPSSQDGILFNMGGTESGTTITVPVNKVGSSAYALALYYSPEDFVRPETVVADETARERTIYIKADYRGTQTSFPIRITRPPVILIHGLWGSRIGWDEFRPLHCVENHITDDDDRFWIRVFDYETTNDESFDINSRRVFAQTSQAVRNYKRDEDVAAVQVDAVTHSMGGVLARAAYGLEVFWTNEPTFGEGYFHKVINIGTPHFGSPWAATIIGHAVGFFKSIFSHTLNIDPTSDALKDLAWGSSAIQHLTGTEGPLSHNIIGTCPEPISIPIDYFLAAINHSGSGENFEFFSQIFDGQENDLIVGADSQRGGFAVGASTISEFSPVIHSGNSWLEKISGNTVYETQHFSIAQKAIQLLNQPLRSNLFASLPAKSWSSSETAFAREAPCSTPAAQGGITVSSPQDGALFEVGETVTVTAQPTDGVILDMVFLGSSGFLLLDDATPFEFTFDLPEDCVGPRDISVLGVDTSGNTYLDEITINVVTSASLTNLGVDPQEIEHLRVGDSVILHVWGDFSDGQTIDLTEAPETCYSSDNNGAASVDTDGVVTGVGKGSGVITVTYGDQTVTANVNVEASNDRPIAEAGPDQTVALGHSVQLDGSGSNDPDTDPLTYAWEIVSNPGGSTTTLLNPDAVNPTFILDVAGQYIAKLTVDDGNGGTESDTVLVTAIEETPAVFRVEGSTGNVYSDAAFYGQAFLSGSADVAEWVPVSESVQPGDVLELDPDNPGQYRKSHGPCSDLVAGVVSTEPGFVLGSLPATEDSGLPAPDRALLALLGIVPVKVTNEGGPIQPGDLLVTSSTPGHAMRWEPGSGESCNFVVGKALETLTGKCGVISVLLMAH